MVYQRRWSVKGRGDVPEEVVSQGQGWCTRGGGQSRAGVMYQRRWSVKGRGDVPEEVVSQGQG